MCSFADYWTPIIAAGQTFVLICAAAIAIRQVKASRDVAAKRATYDAVMYLITEEKFRAATRVLNGLRKKGVLSSTLYAEANRVHASAESKSAAHENQQAAQLWLNRFAAIATAIRNNALDEQYFKEVYYSSFMVNTDYLDGYINSLREQAKSTLKPGSNVSSATAFQEILWLYNRWNKAPLQPFSGEELEGSRWRLQSPIAKR